MKVICHFYYLFADENVQNVFIFYIKTLWLFEYPKLTLFLLDVCLTFRELCVLCIR